MDEGWSSGADMREIDLSVFKNEIEKTAKEAAVKSGRGDKLPIMILEIG